MKAIAIRAAVPLLIGLISAPVYAVRLSVPPALSRPATDRDDWTQMIPTRGKIVGQEDCDRPMLSAQTLSLDGGYAYQQVCRWVTSDDIVQVRLSDGTRREVHDGNSLAVIRNGPWRGFLLIEEHRRPITRGNPADATWIVRPDGKDIMAVPGSDNGNRAAVRKWLSSHAWVAS